jgi:hypothetical protein
MSFHRSVLPAVVAIGLGCASAAFLPARAEGGDAGLVVDYAPPRASHALVRHGSSVESPVRLGTVVQADDVVKLRSEGHVTIQLADGTEKEIDGPGEWRVPESSQPGAFARILHSLEGLLEKQATVAASAASRGSEDCDTPEASLPIRVPILRAHARVTAGSQTLAVGWFGGCPPYAVSLRSGSTETGRADGLAKRLYQFRDVNLAAGVYRVEIRDRFGKSASFTLEAVSEGPVVPADLAADRTSADGIARALWLAGQDGGSWRLESLKTLRPLLAQKNRIAVQLADYLLSSDD